MGARLQQVDGRLPPRPRQIRDEPRQSETADALRAERLDLPCAGKRHAEPLHKTSHGVALKDVVRPYARGAEQQAADEVKRDIPVMVVMGNPPYSGESANKGEWIMRKMEKTTRSSPEG